WIIDPAEGAEVTVPFEVSGLANAFEANVQWELMQGDTVVKEGFTMAEEAFTMAPYSFRVKDVPPGDYTLVVHDSDPSGGEGFAPWVDTKNITVVE
ncbi:MAG TPA: Gmad2 immunoglobulin-like domain-containing protein, partial [Nocardioidaceae bacterium]|nr:Gmad2 immunoglobulin-like domain-containing protein [Nocardioidaceae bacterium]